MTTLAERKSEELRAQAAKALKEARNVNDKAESEGRSLSGDERESIERAFNDHDSYMSRAQLKEREEAEERRQNEPIEERARRLPEVVEDEDATPEEREAVGLAETPEYRTAFYRYAAGGDDALTYDDRRALQEVRALTEGVDSDGGYLAPPQLIAGVIRDASDIEQLAPRMNTINASVRSIRQIKGVDTVQFQWVAELAPKPEDQPTFARDEIFAHTAAVIVRVSDELLEDTAFNLEAYLAALAAEAKVEGEEAAFVGGSGNTQPFGVLTRLNGETGAPNRYTTAAAGAIAGDDFVKALYGLKARYRRQAAWVLGTPAILAARLLKETGSSNQYLWQPGLQAGQPASILGKPVIEAYDGENTASPLDNPVATGNDVGFVGDLRKYTVLRRLQMQVKRLEELYAETDEIGFRFRFRTGGDVQNTAAFKSIRIL